MTTLVNKDVKAVIITIFHMFKLKKNFSMSHTDTNTIF